MNLINDLLSKYSLRKIATITGVSVTVLKDLRAGMIPDHITKHSGKYIAARSVLEAQIKESIQKYKTRLK